MTQSTHELASQQIQTIFTETAKQNKTSLLGWVAMAAELTVGLHSCICSKHQTSGKNILWTDKTKVEVFGHNVELHI